MEVTEEFVKNNVKDRKRTGHWDIVFRTSEKTVAVLSATTWARGMIS